MAVVQWVPLAYQLTITAILRAAARPFVIQRAHAQRGNVESFLWMRWGLSLELMNTGGELFNPISKLLLLDHRRFY